MTRQSYILYSQQLFRVKLPRRSIVEANIANIVSSNKIRTLKTFFFLSIFSSFHFSRTEEYKVVIINL